MNRRTFLLSGAALALLARMPAVSGYRLVASAPVSPAGFTPAIDMTGADLLVVSGIGDFVSDNLGHVWEKSGPGQWFTNV